MSTTSSKLKVAALAVLLGTATVAAAQSPSEAQAFASQLQQYQALSGIGTYTFHTAPKFSNTPQDPVGSESFSQRFADMQAASSNSSDWQETRTVLRVAIAGAPSLWIKGPATVPQQEKRPQLRLVTH